MNPASSTVSTSRATLIGFSAILTWSSLPLLTLLAGKIPPFQMTAMAFAVSFLLTLVKWQVAGESIRNHLTMQPSMWALGIFGIFGFHFFYFLAYQSAPAVDVLLIDNLWPLLIVLLSALINGDKLKWQHLAGVLFGFAGVVVVTTQKGDGPAFSSQYLLGYLEAFACGFTWALYSVLNRKVASRMPRDAVGAYCGATALLSLICHLIFEDTVPVSATQIGLIVIMGIGPIGAAFFTWDYGMRYGNIQALSAMSYTGLVIAAGSFILFGIEPYSPVILIATALILSGVILGTLDFSRRKGPLPQP
ncbi:MAG: EamA family transporter [Alphaproteobacteria bacterium]|nr:EamA family transporter [Alphaproteobacteria bacterium]